MELLLWRHAEAEAGEPDEPDSTRRLTAKGHKQAHKIGQWLDRNLPSGCKVLVSPAARTVQTAEALGRRYKLCAELATGAAPAAILAAAGWPHAREPVLVIGHQPTLGQTAALLLSGTAQDWTLRKGSVWWIVQRERDGQSGNYLKAVLSPELVIS